MTKRDGSDTPSFFKRAFTAAPTAVGLGVSISRMLKSTNVFGKIAQPLAEMPKVAAGAIKSFTENYSDLSSQTSDQLIEKINMLADTSSMPLESIKKSVMRAAKYADPSGNLENQLDMRLSAASSTQEAFKDIATVFADNDSIYTKKAASSFMRTMEVLHDRTSKGLSNQMTSISSGQVPTVVQRLQMNQLSPTMQTHIRSMGSQLGMDVRISQTSRTDLPGAELSLEFFGTSKNDKYPQFELRIPRSLPDNPAIVTRGKTLQSRYIAGMYGEVKGGVLQGMYTHEEYMVRRAAEEWVPGLLRNKVIDARHRRLAARTFEQETSKNLNWILSTNMKDFYRAEEAFSTNRSRIMRLFTIGKEHGVTSFKPIDELNYYDVMKKGLVGQTGELFPAYSPGQFPKGVVSTQDVRGFLSLTPGAVDYGRRPGQGLRPGFNPTVEAEAMALADRRAGQMGWAASRMGPPSPMVKSLFLSASLGPKLNRTGVSSEGGLVIERSAAKLIAMDKISTFDVSLDKIGPDIASLLDTDRESALWKINQNLKKGSLLGLDPQTGEPVVLPRDMQILEASGFANDEVKDSFLRITALESNQKISHMKVFGGAKGMATVEKSGYVRKIVKGLGFNPKIANGVQALITMDELKKNRGLHNNQMLTALYEFTKANMQSGKTKSTLASNFVNHPYSVVAMINQMAEQAGKFSHESVLRNTMYLARAGNLDPQQMGLAFGAVPDVAGDEGLQTLSSVSKLHKGELRAIREGKAMGHTQLFFGGTGGSGSGGLGWVEPRSFELLSSSHLGEIGPLIQEDLLQRTMVANPEKIFEQRELGTSLQSMLNLGKRDQAVSASSILKGLGPDELLPQTGTNLRVGGIGDMYIPGAGTLRPLASYRTSSGTITDLPLAHAYRDVLEGAQRLESGEIDQAAFGDILSAAKQETFQSYVGTVTKKGSGLIRTKVPGSMNLTAVVPTLSYPDLPEGVIGVTKPYAERAFKQMRKLRLYDERQLNDLESQFMKGERITGWTGRSPYTDPFSTQIVEFQKIRGKQDIAIINERQVNAMITRTPRGTGATKKTIENLTLRLSPMVNQSGDFDGDTISAFFAGPQLQDKLKAYREDPIAQQLERENTIRTQVLKAKAKQSGDILLSDLKAGAGVKLGVTEGGRLGKLSLSLQNYRAAVLMNAKELGIEGGRQALAGTTFLEQVPISSKHVAGGQELGFIASLEKMQTALMRRNERGITEAFREIMQTAKMSGQGALHEGFRAMIEEAPGKTSAIDVTGLEIEKASRYMVQAMDLADKTTVNSLSMSRIRQMTSGRAKGRTAPTDQEMLAFMTPEVASSIPQTAAFTESLAGKKMFSRVATRALTMSNRVAAAGRGLIQNAKPLAIGFGVSLGLATLLSEPPRSLESGASIPSPVSKGGTGGGNQDTNIHPQDRVRGMPTARSMESSVNTARVGTGMRVRINANNSVPINYNSLTSQLRSTVNSNARIHTSVRDVRSSLTPQRLSRILNDE